MKISDHSQVAKMIRKDLKAAYPQVKFSVTSSSYAGGNSVNVKWENGPTSQMIEDLTDKYEAGKFNSMEDLYEYDHSKSGRPTVKYIITSRSITDEKRAEIRKEIEKKFGCDLSDERDIFSRFQCWPDTLIYREYKDRAFL